MNAETWNNWINRVNWILNIASQRNWDYSDLTVKDPVSDIAFENLEKELNIQYPDDFKEILTRYSAGVFMRWQIDGEDTEGDFGQILCGAREGYLWDFETLKDQYISYQDWIQECFSDPENKYDKVWHHKIPFIDVGNGDFIAFGDKTDKGNQVVYLSHDGDDFHGKKLGDNFIDFIERWTQTGCAGTESWQFEPFYNDETQQFLANKSKLDEWRKWLEK